LLETSIILLIGGTMLQMVLMGQQLIHSARVRDIMAQQAAAETAIIAFQDRYRALPGDYDEASSNIACDAGSCIDGNGNGLVEAGINGAIHEEILAWHHLRAAGLIEGNYSMADPAVSQAHPSNTPRNAFGGYLQLAYDKLWGYSGQTTTRHNVKTGNQVSAEVLAEVDRKIDDGFPGAGRFQFSTYAANGTAPAIGAATGVTCTNTNAANAQWRAVDGADNCGAATLLR
jgi:hypothetical protein